MHYPETWRRPITSANGRPQPVVYCLGSIRYEFIPASILSAEQPESRQRPELDRWKYGTNFGELLFGVDSLLYLAKANSTFEIRL